MTETLQEAFANKMAEIQTQWEDDEEVCHSEMDNLMCDLLRHMGFGEGVDIFENTPKWYA